MQWGYAMKVRGSLCYSSSCARERLPGILKLAQDDFPGLGHAKCGVLGNHPTSEKETVCA